MLVRWIAVIAAVAAMVFTAPSLASADGQIVVSTGGFSVGNAEGSRLTVYNQAVAPEIVGNTCTGTLDTGNNVSVHPGNAVVITTNGVEYVIPNVEDGEFQTVSVDGTITIGDSLLVEVQFGPDGATSGGLELTLNCVSASQPEPPTPGEPDFTG